MRNHKGGRKCKWWQADLKEFAKAIKVVKIDMKSDKAWAMTQKELEKDRLCDSKPNYGNF